MSGKRNGRKGYVLVIILLCVVLMGVVLANALGREQHVSQSPGTSTTEAVAPVPEVEIPVETAQPAAQPEGKPSAGTLIEENTGLNENLFAGMDYFGGASDITDTSFVMGKATMIFDKNAAAYMGTITVMYNEDTVFQRAVLYNSEDRYELYSSDLNTFKAESQENGYTNCIVFLEDPEAEELVAKRVIMDRYADL